MNSNFDNIVLTHTEKSTLYKLYKHEPLQLKSETYKLEELKLVQPRQIDTDSDGYVQYDNFFFLSDLGRRYCLYKKRISRGKLFEWIRYIITTLIAIAALTLSIISLYMQYER